MFYNQLFERYILFQEVDIIYDIKYLVINKLYDISINFEEYILDKIETIVRKRCIPQTGFYFSHEFKGGCSKLTCVDNRIGLVYATPSFNIIIKYIIDNYLYYDSSYTKNRLICDFDDAFKHFVKSPLNYKK